MKNKKPNHYSDFYSIFDLEKDKLIRPTVEWVNSQLLERYPDNINHSGQCDLASAMFCGKINEKINQWLSQNNPIVHVVDIKAYCIHGELCHKPYIPSDHWPCQHTWACVEIGLLKIYVDPTSKQFKDLFPGIPDYYISNVKPWYLYADRDNPLWKFKIICKINDMIHVPVYTGGISHKEGIIEFLQYEVWGRISDKIGSILYKKESIKRD